jgi:hypothetical protein
MRLKVRFAFTELFFKGINGNSGGEKEKQGVGGEIFEQFNLCDGTTHHKATNWSKLNQDIFL